MYQYIKYLINIVIFGNQKENKKKKFFFLVVKPMKGIIEYNTDKLVFAEYLKSLKKKMHEKLKNK